MFSQRYSHRVYEKSPSTGTTWSCAASRNHPGELRTTIVSVLIASCAFLATCVAGCSAVTFVPVRHSGSRQFLVVPVVANGIQTTFLFDTGTSDTVVSKEFADRNGIHGRPLQRDRPIEASAGAADQEDQYVRLRSFRVGSVRAKRKVGPVQIVDLPRLGAQFGGDVTGMLGNAMWSSADYVLDASQPSLVISRRLNLSASPEASHLSVSGNRTYLPVKIDGRTFDFLLDTGSSATRVTQEVIDEIRPSDYLELEITTMGSTEYRRIPALHAKVAVGLVQIPQFSFLIGEENVIGLNLLRYGVLSVSNREGMFVFRGREGP